ncbi:MAG: glycosyltransferase family 4 protein [Verrucomicrobiota bacterium]
MPGESQTGDEPDLIRTEYANLESAGWWQSHRLDGVVLYAWGSPKYRKVAAAIRNAGIFLVLNQDNGGLVSPLAGIKPWLNEQWILSGSGRNRSAYLRFLRLILRGLSIGLFVTDPLRACHLGHGNLIACVSPIAADYYRKLCGIYGGGKLSSRVVLIPHAVEPIFRFTSAPKQRRVVCVGRWKDTVQKRPWMLMEAMGSLVAVDARVEVAIVGSATPELETWHNSLPQGQRSRVRLLGFTGRVALADLLRESQVFYSPSAFESFGIAAAEAMCSGCSVVAGRSVSMASFEWFISEASGTLASEDDAKGHLEALQHELDRWDRNDRDPGEIAGIWQERLHADRVAAKTLELSHRPRIEP